MTGKLTCTSCKKTKSHWDFGSAGVGRIKSICKPCYNTKRRERQAAKKVSNGHIDFSFESFLPEVDDREPFNDEQPKTTKQTPPAPTFQQSLPASQIYVVTYAQNATPVNEPFLRSLENYCEHRRATLIVIPGRYKNPTSIWSKDMEHDEWWDSSLEPYLFNGRAELPHLTIFGDISIQPTAIRPLTGFEVFAGASSAVFGHPKIQVSTVATAKRRYPRIFTTTGAVTQPNYTASKAGKKGEAHHVYGATIIEQGVDLFHVRQVTGNDDGSFTDLDKVYDGEKVTLAPPALALVCGDIHVDKSDLEVLDATFNGPDSIVATLRPKQIIYHDLCDFSVRNHHSINNFSDRLARASGDMPDLVEKEIERAIKFIDIMTPDFAEPIIIASNHDEAFDRWLQEANPKVDPLNARFFHECWAKMIREYETTKQFPAAFEMMYRERGADRARFIGRDEPYKVGDIYCNFHGDKGTNGARGNSLSFAKLGVKTITGHSHSPGWLDGNVTVGVTGSLDMGYNSTPSSWLNSHCVVNADLTRTLIHIIGGAWRGAQ